VGHSLGRGGARGALPNTWPPGTGAGGGPGGGAPPRGVIPELASDRFDLDIRTVTYEELGKLVEAAMADTAAMSRARSRADAYLKLPGTRLETRREFVDNAFLLEEVFRGLMAKANCGAITINGCMGTIMPVSQTTACLSLSTLNDDGYLAYCESDFVVIPSGMLLTNISGQPMFFNDPTYPHHGVITLAHCTGPRKMDGKTVEPTRIMTHFESDYGAAPKVDMRIGQKVTMIAPDFKFERWMGLRGEIADHPFYPICRDQIDVRFAVDDQVVAERMPGFHWMLIYGDYSREVGYALRRTPIEWDFLG
jgi:L-fucose isomerase-like protein